MHMKFFVTTFFHRVPTVRDEAWDNALDELMHGSKNNGGVLSIAPSLPDFSTKGTLVPNSPERRTVLLGRKKTANRGTLAAAPQPAWVSDQGISETNAGTHAGTKCSFPESGDSYLTDDTSQKLSCFSCATLNGGSPRGW